MVNSVSSTQSEDFNGRCIIFRCRTFLLKMVFRIFHPHSVPNILWLFWRRKLNLIVEMVYFFYFFFFRSNGFAKITPKAKANTVTTNEQLVFRHYGFDSFQWMALVCLTESNRNSNSPYIEQDRRKIEFETNS